jgi:hypothetical protein
MSELGLVREQPALVLNLLNETLSDVDYETQGMQRIARANSRICLTAGMAAGCIEIALRVQTSSLRAATLAAIAVTTGIVGAVSCAVIGQWATRLAMLRRRLWDEFVHWILNSEFPQTAWTVRAAGLRPTNNVENGQDT